MENTPERLGIGKLLRSGSPYVAHDSDGPCAAVLEARVSAHDRRVERALATP